MPLSAKHDVFLSALDLLVLHALKIEPQHGYALVARIRQLSRYLLRAEEGGLYPALQRLLKSGLGEAR